MNFTNCYKRNNFVERHCLSSQISSSHLQRSRSGRDPFEGDPFKVQSLNFRYADKPAFFPVSSRGKGTVAADKTPLKNIYYNHDHTIPKCDKENLPLGHPMQSTQSRGLRKSGSFRSVSVASKVYSPEKSVSLPAPNMSQPLNTDSEESGLRRKRNTLIRESELSKSKSSIGQLVPSTSSSMETASQVLPGKRVANQINISGTNNRSAAVADINMPPGGSCHITIKINGVPRNRVHINKCEENIEVNLNKSKKAKKSRSRKVSSPHALKPSRSYVIHKAEPPADPLADVRNTDQPHREVSKKDLKESSTHSMIPHREEKSPSQDTNLSQSTIDTIKAYSSVRLGSVSGKFSQMTIPNRTLDRQASMLERILSNNPIVVQPKGRVLFTRSKTSLCKRCSSATTLDNKSFSKMDRVP